MALAAAVERVSGGCSQAERTTALEAKLAATEAHHKHLYDTAEMARALLVSSLETHNLTMQPSLST